MKKSVIFLASLLTLAVTAIVIVALVMMRDKKDEDRFSVSGTGKVYARADIANIEVGLKVEAKKTAAEATAESTKKMDEVIKAFKSIGIDEKDIKTTNYNLNPVYNWTEKSGQVLTGYEVYQNVTLKIRDLSKIGEVIAKGTEKGANQVGNISFTIDDEYSLRNQARELAIGKAKEKAALIASQAGMKLGEVKSVIESSDPMPVQAYANAKMMDLSAGASNQLAAPTIQAGQNEIQVNVTLVYEVK